MPTTLTEITQETLAQNPALAALLQEGEKVHAFGNHVGRDATADLFQRVAPSAQTAQTAPKRAFALSVEGEDLPRFVVYTAMNKVQTTQDDKGEVRIDPAAYPAAMRAILGTRTDAVQAPNIAVCYSISNLQPQRKDNAATGGMLLGALYDKLRAEGVREIVTLSPAPNLQEWLQQKQQRQDSSMLDEQARSVLARMQPNLSPIDALCALYEDANYNALKGEALQAFNGILEDVTRYYLLEAAKSEKEGLTATPLRVFDGVQGFHMGNGAQLAKVTAQRQQDSDTALITHPDGISQNKVNVSYRYVPEQERAQNVLALQAGYREASPTVMAQHVAYCGKLMDAPMQEAEPQQTPNSL
jgi:hypothetical protein